jgi:putative flippase GtrA
MNNIRQTLIYLIRYAFYSGTAVLCEICIFAFFFRSITLPPFWANAISAVAGLALAWFISGHRVFVEKKITLGGHITWYIYQIFAIWVYSYIVSWLIIININYIISKIIVLGISFTVNSCFFKAIILKNK